VAAAVLGQAWGPGIAAFPAVVLLVSGGHTLLVDMSSPGHYDVLGETVDDAAGEAFDKVGRYLGLSYPGGPEIERLASNGDPKAISFPRPMLNDGLEFSFSGLKTAVVRYVREHRNVDSADVAASFQAALVEVLVEKSLRAAAATNARSICLAGGVAANGPLRKALTSATEQVGLKVFLPSASMCTDNAAMIAAAAHVNLRDHGATELSHGAVPGLRLRSRHEVRTS